MTIENMLRKQLSRAYGGITWEENPLVTIGLSHAILTLKVTERQLFQIVRGYVRQLAAAVHPDAMAVGDVPETPEIAEERVKIMQAFEFLDNADTFSKALQEFRTLKGEESREIATLKTSLRITHQRLETALAEMRDLGMARRDLEREWGVFKERQAREKEVVPSLTLQLNAANERRDKWHHNLRAKIRTEHNLMSFIRWFTFGERVSPIFSPTDIWLGLVSFELISPSSPFSTPNIRPDHITHPIPRDALSSLQEYVGQLSQAAQADLSALEADLHVARSREWNEKIEKAFDRRRKRIRRVIEAHLAPDALKCVKEAYARQVGIVQQAVYSKFGNNGAVRCTFQPYLISKGRIEEQFIGGIKPEDIRQAFQYNRSIPNDVVFRHLTRYPQPGSFLLALSEPCSRTPDINLLDRILNRRDSLLHRRPAKISVFTTSKIVLGTMGVCDQCGKVNLGKRCLRCGDQICIHCDHTREVCQRNLA